MQKGDRFMIFGIPSTKFVEKIFFSFKIYKTEQNDNININAQIFVNKKYKKS
jgi:hypothetical protein